MARRQPLRSLHVLTLIALTLCPLRAHAEREAVNSVRVADVHVGPPSAAAHPHGLSDSLAHRATARLQAFLERRRIPGLSAAVGHGGRAVWDTTLGVSDLESKAPLTRDSVFPLGSTSKVLTSVALGRLIEARRLDVDAPIQTYVPYFPEKEHVLTARLLAGHLSGIRDYDRSGGEYHNTRNFKTSREAVEVFMRDSLLFEPGTAHAYSAYNFVLLGAAIESASGQEFLSYVRDQVTSPLRMTRTGPDRRPAPMPGLVTCYTAGFMSVPAPAMPLDVSNKWAAGGFVSTPTEMVQLGNALLTHRLLKADTFRLLTTPQQLTNGRENTSGYALGWRAGRAKLPISGRDVQVVHHGGTANGAMSFFVLLPEEGLVVSLQCNLLFTPFVELATEAYALADLFLQK